MLQARHSVPGVYRRPAPRAQTFVRPRTDVVGFVGIAGPNRIGEAVRCDDWQSYEQTYLRDERGRPMPRPRGAVLADTVRAYFTNGGARCWIVNIAATVDELLPDELLNRMLGLDTGQRIGLELLLAQPEVSLVALPELDAVVEVRNSRVVDNAIAEQGAFASCCAIDSVQPGKLPPDRTRTIPLFPIDPSPRDSAYLFAQRYLLQRCYRERWRVFALLGAPRGLDEPGILDWHEALTENLSTDDNDCAGLYWPWLLTQEIPGDPVTPRSPIGFVAGVFARKDLARGPHASPANEPLRGVVGLEHQVNDATNGAVYDRGINVLRSFPSQGIYVWGARTLRFTSPEASTNDGLAYINVRRCLSAIERACARLGERAVFEPHTFLLRAQLGQSIVGYLLTVFRSGALAGGTPEEAFFVRCDESINPPEAVERGELICEVGVAIAAPAELIVFRIGRREGVIEIEEVG